MGKVNKKKLEEYSKKLYNGLLKQYRKDGKYKGRIERVRAEPTTRQGRGVIENAKRKCVICSTKFDEAPAAFEIHHIDGNRENDISSNFVLLCAGCHNTVHDIAGAAMDDYKKRQKKGEPPKKPEEFINKFMNIKWV